jgi:hypothetical protein
MNIEVAGIRKFAFAMVAGLLFVAAAPDASAQAVEGKQYSRINPFPLKPARRSRSSNSSYGVRIARNSSRS